MRIREIRKGDSKPLRLQYSYKTCAHYAVRIKNRKSGWLVSAVLEELPNETEKHFEEVLFAPHVEEPRVFVASVDGEDVGWMEVGFQAWNNRLRLWEFLVKEEFRGRGIGRALIRKAKAVAEEKSARMIVLETQSCNVPAIGFYRSQGFDLIGMDVFAYSDRDIEEGEVRFEFGMRVGRNHRKAE